MNKYDVTVVDYPAKSLIGLKVRTSMPKAEEDTTTIWQTFGPRIGELSPPAAGCTGAYGISVMLNAEDFDYWAAAEAAASSSIPSGMGRIEIPAGRYAKCAVPNVEKLMEAFMYVFDEWLKGQKEYVYAEPRPSFEWYPPNWHIAAPLEIYMPVKKV